MHRAHRQSMYVPHSAALQLGSVRSLPAAPRSGSPPPTSTRPLPPGSGGRCLWMEEARLVAHGGSSSAAGGKGHGGERACRTAVCAAWELGALDTACHWQQTWCLRKAPSEPLTCWVEAGSCCCAMLALGVFKSATVPKKEGSPYLHGTPRTVSEYSLRHAAPR